MDVSHIFLAEWEWNATPRYKAIYDSLEFHIYNKYERSQIMEENQWLR